MDSERERDLGGEEKGRAKEERRGWEGRGDGGTRETPKTHASSCEYHSGSWYMSLQRPRGFSQSIQTSKGPCVGKILGHTQDNEKPDLDLDI